MASGDAILIHDHPEGKIIAKNPAYQRIVGTSEEEKLKLYRRIFITTNDGVAIVDPEGRRLIDCNPALLRYMGISKKEAPGKPISTLFDEETYAEVIQAISEKDSYRGEVVFRHEDGVVYFVDLSIYPIRNEENVLICYVGMGRDITQRKQDQEALATRLRWRLPMRAGRTSSRILRIRPTDSARNPAGRSVRPA
jgi:PAS domain S-box-containing protein